MVAFGASAMKIAGELLDRGADADRQDDDMGFPLAHRTSLTASYREEIAGRSLSVLTLLARKGQTSTPPPIGIPGDERPLKRSEAVA